MGGAGLQSRLRVDVSGLEIHKVQAPPQEHSELRPQSGFRVQGGGGGWGSGFRVHVFRISGLVFTPHPTEGQGGTRGVDLHLSEIPGRPP